MQDRTIITNLVGKGGRVRSVSVPAWTAQIMREWIAQVKTGRVLRSVQHDGTINRSLSPAAIRDIVRRYGPKIGVPGLAPHDLRRTCARLARLGGAPMEVIQHTLGHANQKTTEIYTQTGEEANAGDFIQL
jgi:integrase